MKNSGGAIATCALSGRRKRALDTKTIKDEPIDGAHYRPDNEMSKEDKESFIRSLKVSKSSEQVFALNFMRRFYPSSTLKEFYNITRHI